MIETGVAVGDSDDCGLGNNASNYSVDVLVFPEVLPVMFCTRSLISFLSFSSLNH